MPSERSNTAVSGTGQNRSSGQREQFSAEELAIVLSHYDIGAIDSIVEYPARFAQGPQAAYRQRAGEVPAQAAGAGKDDPFKVAFTHSLQLYLANQQFTLPHLIGTRKDNNSMLQWRNGVYELFEFIPGQGYPQTLESTFDAGRILAVYHKLLEEFKSEWQPSTGSYHAAPAVEQSLKSIAAGLPGGPESDHKDVHELLKYLLAAYRRAAERIVTLGIDNWPRQIVHADWHPGNMIFRDNRVVAVIDYDSARLLPRIIDIANGSLQFSIIGGDDDVSKWPDYIDEARFKRFLRGYDEVMLLSQAEIRTVPYLMIEALIAEAVFPIAATGSFGKVEGMPFLQMVQRKIQWMQKNYDHLVEIVEQ